MIDRAGLDEAARRLDERLSALPVTKGGHWRRDPSEVELEALRRYWGTGRPIKLMASAFGVSENTLRRWAREADLLMGAETCNGLRISGEESK